MNVNQLTVTPEVAEAMLRKYREHRAWSTPVDREIEQVYAKIAKGKVVLQMASTIATAGLGSDSLPRLAIGRADGKRCLLRTSSGVECH